jgi:hypothetical protein
LRRNDHFLDAGAVDGGLQYGLGLGGVPGDAGQRGGQQAGRRSDPANFLGDSHNFLIRLYVCSITANPRV